MKKQQLIERLECLKLMIETMKISGNWDFNSYMHGLTNGLILSVSVMEATKPEILEKPETWLEDLQKDGLEKKE